MPKSKPPNLRRDVPRASIDIVNRLNAIDPGLGSAYARDVARIAGSIGRVQSGASGQRGTITIAKQKRDSTGTVPPAMDVQGGQIVGGTWASEGSAFVTLDQVRSMFTCKRFGGHVSGFPGWFEECVEQEEAAVAAGIVHAMWGYTYDIPNFTDTVVRDPGSGESGAGNFWQMIIPATTTLDRVSVWIPAATQSFADGSLLIGLYDCNQDSAEFPIVASSEPLELAQNETIEPGRITLALDSTITIEPGIYAVAYLAPCFDILCILGNDPIFRLVNQLWNEFGDVNPIDGLNRYGAFLIEEDEDNPGTYFYELPDSLNRTNTVPQTAAFNTWVPMTYWDDSATFG